jgi:integrase/recombinase XerD
LKRIGDLPLNAITVTLCHDFIYRDQPSTQTAARHFRQLRRAFNLAVRWKLLEDNPLLGLDCPKPIQRKKDTLNENEFEQFITALPMNSFSGRRFKRMVILARLTGVRESELLNLTLEDVLEDDRVILIRNCDSFRTKSGKHRFVPLSSMALEIINSQLTENEQHHNRQLRTSKYIFPNSSGLPLSVFTISEQFRKHSREILPDKKNLCFHSLRGSFITSAIEDGVPIAQIQIAVGHSSIVTTQSYIAYDRIKVQQLAHFLETIRITNNK